MDAGLSCGFLALLLTAALWCPYRSARPARRRQLTRDRDAEIDAAAYAPPTRRFGPSFLSFHHRLHDCLHDSLHDRFHHRSHHGSHLRPFLARSPNAPVTGPVSGAHLPRWAALRRVVAIALCVTPLLSLCVEAHAIACEPAPNAAALAVCQREMQELNGRLRDLLVRFTEAHPDVRALRLVMLERGSACTSPTPPATAASGVACTATGSPSSTAHGAFREPAAVPRPGGPAATVTINMSALRQTLYGFGATQDLNVLANNRMSDDQWRRALNALAVDIGAHTGTAPPPVEYSKPRPLDSKSGFSRAIDFSGAQTLLRLTERFSPGAFGDLVANANIDTRRSHPWLNAIKATDPARYLEEVAAKALATVAFWHKQTGQEPEFLQLWNEPTSGNRELEGASVADMVAIIKHTGRALRKAGFAKVRLLVGNEETIGDSLRDLRAVIQDDEARSYVGALGYHVYPYGSDYSYLPRLLSNRAQGNAAGSADGRQELRQLSRRWGIPVWMTEVSNGYSPRGPREAKESYVPDSIDWIVGRAIHLHDEFRFAGASAYYGMLAMWTDAADRDHFPFGGSRNLRSEGDHLILVDTATDEVIITGMGRAIGHYGRWLKRGARYLDGESSSPFVLVSPFIDRGRLVAVLVNTAATSVRVTVRLQGATFAGSVTGEQTRAGAMRQAMPPFIAEGASLTIELAGWSVTSVAVPLR